jgi:uncharacterized protein (AIM24 family)
MIEFKLTRTDEIEQLFISIHDNQLYIDPSFIKYIKGSIQFIKNLSKRQTIIKYYQHGARSLIPKVEGSGTIYLKPIYGHFNILDIGSKKNQNLICKKDVFVASEPEVEFKPTININLQRLLSSLPIRNYQLSGTGKVILYSNGPLQVIELYNEKISLYSGQVVAYSEQLKITETISNDGFWGLSKKNKTIIDFFGTGVIYLVSHPNHLYLLANNFNHTA